MADHDYGSNFTAVSHPLLSKCLTNPTDHRDASKKHLFCLEWSSQHVLKDTDGRRDHLVCRFSPVSQPGRQSPLFLRVFFLAPMICGYVDKTNRTNCSTL